MQVAAEQEGVTPLVVEATLLVEGVTLLVEGGMALAQAFQVVGQEQQQAVVLASSVGKMAIGAGTAQVCCILTCHSILSSMRSAEHQSKRTRQTSALSGSI